MTPQPRCATSVAPTTARPRSEDDEAFDAGIGLPAAARPVHCGCAAGGRAHPRQLHDDGRPAGDPPAADRYARIDHRPAGVLSGDTRRPGGCPGRIEHGARPAARPGVGRLAGGRKHLFPLAQRMGRPPRHRRAGRRVVRAAGAAAVRVGGRWPADDDGRRSGALFRPPSGWPDEPRLVAARSSQRLTDQPERRHPPARAARRRAEFHLRRAGRVLLRARCRRAVAIRQRAGRHGARAIRLHGVVGRHHRGRRRVRPGVAGAGHDAWRHRPDALVQAVAGARAGHGPAQRRGRGLAGAAPPDSARRGHRSAPELRSLRPR